MWDFCIRKVMNHNRILISTLFLCMYSFQLYPMLLFLPLPTWSSINDIRIDKLHWNLIPVYKYMAMDFYRCYIQVQFFKIFWLTVQLFRLKYRAASKNYRWHEFIFLVLWPTHQISRAYIYLMEVSFDPFLSASP